MLSANAPEELSTLSFDHYIQALGMPTPMIAANQSCELCGSDDATLVRERVLAGANLWVPLQICACGRCGLLFQRPRFERGFYQDYYARLYRQVTTGQIEPAEDFVADQVARGRHLVSSLASYLPDRGRLLDLGCAAGGMMKPFLDMGWTGLGVDPDEGAVRYGRDQLGLPLKVMDAEDCEVMAGPFDLVLITGSLEHVADPGEVLRRAHQATSPGAHLLVEGWGLGQARRLGGFGHNQRRFLTLRTIKLFMLKYGWIPVLATAEPLSGPTRPGSVFVLARRSKADVAAALDQVLIERMLERPDETLRKLEDWGIG